MLDGRPGPSTNLWDDGLETNFLNVASPIELAFLLGAPTLDAKPASGATASQDRDGIHLRVSAAGFEWVEYVFDPGTYLPIGLTGVPFIPDLRTGKPIRGLRLHYTFDSYQAVSGIQMPTRMTDGEYELRLDFMVNPGIDLALFAEAPTDVRDGSAWRRWIRR